MRETLFRVTAGLLATGGVAAVAFSMLVGSSPGIVSILSFLVTSMVLGSYALRGAQGTIPRLDHVLWLIDLPDRAWGHVTGRRNEESLGWDSSLDGVRLPGEEHTATSEPGGGAAERLLSLHDSVDSLRKMPSAVGFPGVILFLALFVFLLTAADLGPTTTFLATILVASPALVLVFKDLKRARQLRELQRAITESGTALPSGTDSRGPNGRGTEASGETET